MRAAFTLLELLVVLVIVSLLTAIVAVRLREPYLAARFEDTMRRIEFLDNQSRTHARSSAHSCEIVFDVEQRLIYTRDSNDTTTKHFLLALPNSIHIDCVIVPAGEIESGIRPIVLSPRGESETYAVGIATGQTTRKWLLFCGLTGRVAYPKDKHHVQQIFASLTPSDASRSGSDL